MNRGINIITFANKDIRLIIASFCVLLFYLFAYFQQYAPPIYFLISIILIYSSASPKYILHPKNVLFGYSFLWYTIPIMLATRYEDWTFREKEQVLAYCMLIMTYVIGFNVLHFVIKNPPKRNFKVYEIKEIKHIPFKWVHVFFIGFSLVSCLLTMALSPYGIIGWLKNPGASFEFREGSGIATILLIFSTGIALTSGGYFLLKSKRIYNKLILFIFYSILIGIYLICIVHRQRLMNFYILLFLSSLFFLKMKIKRILLLCLLIFGSIYLSSYLRTSDQISDIEGASKFFFNYFDTYDALVVSIKNVEPSFLGTSFMAFKKIFVGMGYDPNMPYSISQWLTPIYFPGWSERSTIQFPIETEMYLNGWYVLLIPILVLYFWMVGFVYKYAFYTKSLGAMFVALYIMLEMIGHLRGMFIDFTDFYNYPIIIISYFLLNRAKTRFAKNEIHIS